MLEVPLPQQNQSKSAQKLEWIKPVVKRMVAGAAEVRFNTNTDGSTQAS